MPLLGATSPRRVIVRTYGRDSLIGLLNPILTLMVRAFGMQLRFRSEEQVRFEMERDAVAMTRKGYRVASSEQFEMQPLGIVWHRVTYELVATPGRR